MTILYNTDVMPVGKHKGEDVGELAKNHPHYVRNFDHNKIAFCDDIMLHVGLGGSPRKYRSLKSLKHH